MTSSAPSTTEGADARRFATLADQARQPTRAQISVYGHGEGRHPRVDACDRHHARRARRSTRWACCSRFPGPLPLDIITNRVRGRREPRDAVGLAGGRR